MSDEAKDKASRRWSDIGVTSDQGTRSETSEREGRTIVSRRSDRPREESPLGSASTLTLRKIKLTRFVLQQLSSHRLMLVRRAWLSGNREKDAFMKRMHWPEHQQTAGRR
jgi:hypothetical protein